MTPIRLRVVEDNPQDWLLFGCLLEDVQRTARLLCQFGLVGRPQGGAV